MPKRNEKYPGWPVTKALADAVRQALSHRGMSYDRLAKEIRRHYHAGTDVSVSNLINMRAASSELVEPICEYLGLDLLSLVATDELQRRVLVALAIARMGDPEELARFVAEIESRAKWVRQNGQARTSGI